MGEAGVLTRSVTEPNSGFFRRGQDSERVFAENLSQIRFGITATGEFHGEVGIVSHILHPFRKGRRAVEVRAQPDVIDAGHLDDVIDVIGEERERCFISRTTSRPKSDNPRWWGTSGSSIAPGRVRPTVAEVVGERHVADSSFIEELQVRQVVLDDVPAFKSHERGKLAIGNDSSHVFSRSRHLGGVRSVLVRRLSPSGHRGSEGKA